MWGRTWPIGCAVLLYGPILAGVAYFLYWQWQSGQLGTLLATFGVLAAVSLVFIVLGVLWGWGPRWLRGTRLEWLTRRETWVWATCWLTSGWLVLDSRGTPVDSWPKLLNAVLLGALSSTFLAGVAAAAALAVLGEPAGDSGPDRRFERAFTTAQITLIAVALGWLIIGASYSIVRGGD